MMRYLLKNESDKDDVVRLALHHSTDGGAEVVVVDEKGERIPGGFLVKLTRDGSLSLFGFINPDFGFNLDAGGHIKIKED